MRVFQKDYYSNLSFGMRVRKQLPARIAEAVNIVANLLGIENSCLASRLSYLQVRINWLASAGP
jgi:ABC-type sugar transport system ATPase subunit